MPKRHIVDYFEMSNVERRDADTLLLVLKDKILEGDSTVQGFNAGMNCDDVAGQTVMHAHIHLILRRGGDVDTLRGCVLRMMGY